MILSDPRNPLALRYHRKLEQLLGDARLDELIVVLGGDGFFLETIGQRNFKGTFLGLNAGTVGFLLNEVEDWEEVARCLQSQCYQVHSFPLLKAQIDLPDGERIQATALNDVYLERATGSMAQLRITIDGHVVVEQLAADGLVCATALGSTAYTYSAGGPPCHPSLRIMTVTPICPHRPRLSSFALPQTSRVRVDVLTPERRPVRVVADGRATVGVEAVEVSYGQREARLAFLEGHSFTQAMVTKILT